MARLWQLHLLHFGIEIDIDRAFGNIVGDPAGAQDRFARCRRGCGLIVPFRVVAYERALIARGVDPVDPRAALGSVHGTCRAEHDHRQAVAPCIEHRHRSMHQPDV